MDLQLNGFRDADATLSFVDELVDILDERGLPTGVVDWKSRAHREGLWHRCFHCWILVPEGPYLLVQRRAAVKDTWPGYLDVTAAGHLGAGEKPLEGGSRELEEELGLNVAPERLIPLGERRIEQEISAGRDREFHDVFLLLDSTSPGDLRLQTEEVDAVLELRLEDVPKLYEKQYITAVEWRTDATDKPRRARVRLSDFVPNEDGYLSWVAAKAWAALEEPAT